MKHVIVSPMEQRTTVKKKSLWKTLWSYRYIYLFILPAVVWYFIFCYVPMYGITLGFKEFRFDKGLLGSPWVGTRYLMQFLTHYDFWKLIRNTVSISFFKLLFGFPAPIILALMLNEIKNRVFKRTVQTLSYLPYFVSWVVVMTIFAKFLSPNAGPVNEWKTALFGGDSIYFMGEPVWFYPIVIISNVWKSVGWNSIIYLAALSTIDPELYEAATIDGAGKWKSLTHITLPGLRPTIGILLILSVGGLMYAGFDQIYLIRNPSNLDVSEILETYILQAGLRQGQFSYAAVIGFFQSVVAFLIVVTTNTIAKKTTEISLW